MNRWYTPSRRQPERHIGTRQAAATLGVTQQTIRDMIRSGRLAAERIQLPAELRGPLDDGNRRTGLGDWRIPIDAWEKFLRAYHAARGAGA